MYLCDLINAYNKINSKLKMKSPLTVDEIEELNNLVEKLKNYINELGFEVMKRQ